MRPLLFLLLVGLAHSAWAKITVTQTEHEPYAPIVATSDTLIPEGAQTQLKWSVTPPAKFLGAPEKNSIHIWAPPGTYSAKLTGVWIKTTPVDIGGKTVQVLEGFGFIEDTEDFSVKGAPNPPPIPPTPPAVNPYPTPSALWVTAVEQVSKIPMSRGDANALANLYATSKAQIAAGTLKTTQDLRAHLETAGLALGIKGKYPGLQEAVTKAMTLNIGLTIRPLEPRDSACLDALAWAVWEAGKGGGQ